MPRKSLRPPLKLMNIPLMFNQIREFQQRLEGHTSLGVSSLFQGFAVLGLSQYRHSKLSFHLL